MSPPSNNPFLDDVSGGSRDGSKPGSYPVKGSRPTRSYPTAREEKERLRDRYKEERNVSGSGGDLPPSYDEVAGSKKSESGYPREKEGSSGHRSHRHRHHRSRGDGDRERSGHGHRGSSHKDKKKGKPAVVPKNVDTIDKMDVTGLFGGSFHHDGPFDACTPHRNKNSKAAPVLAFPADGPNNSIGGASAKKSALNEVFGREEVDDDDELYKTRGANRTVRAMVDSNGSTSTLDAIKPNAKTVTQFDVKGKSQLVHGPTTAGLGSTTFLDGAPASNAAIREDIRNHSHQTRTSGVQRKKSLTQRLQVGGTTNSGVRRSGSTIRSTTEPLVLAKTHSGHLENGEEAGEDEYVGVRFDDSLRKESTGNKLLRRVKSLKVGRKA
ncbi:hypothetical protein HG536_0E00610 [Torulaspora globosa]|uniref:Pal1 cell morphology protein n=1 Tax=Torulaspora globosa TaxID=48254 RepID=A0A7G3ZI15_9SACH|nr:uncharacterized protein HG536_0E00610 [Torulaspora globosa]QLL33151.1 hypothetical protein HG536_0E00610 [Torulaspora globosa]